MESFACESINDGHTGSINCLAALQGTTVFASGAADGTIKVWAISLSSHQVLCTLRQNITTNPKYFPLALASRRLGQHEGSVLLAAGTKSFIQVFASDGYEDSLFALKATLHGHEGWIRSLDIIQENESPGSDLLFASASQDKYIRLWRIHRGVHRSVLIATDQDAHSNSVEKTLSSKAYAFDANGLTCTITFEALLLGHEDWVYTAIWDKCSSSLRLLSASADSSLALWEPEKLSGVWVCTTRLGEISVQKGSTTATGSAGGYSVGLWLHDGSSVASLGRTGSWRVWNCHNGMDRWLPAIGVSGHIEDVRGITWAKDGSYLLSASSDQTTRLHAEWKRDGKCSWHEFARPQIHGYDLNCIESISRTQFISGADEKLLRVFDEPRATADLLNELSGADAFGGEQLPEIALIPVLGLSNKAIDPSGENGATEEDDRLMSDKEAQSSFTATKAASNRPPFEDDLARQTLWPEKEKLYGHGFEISAVAASGDGRVIATACKASSLDHAVIRLYETTTWRESQPSLKAHTLTVTCLRFSDDSEFLLSVGRDRRWAVFYREEIVAQHYHAYATNAKGHSRMILGAAWAPSTIGRVFATAGRDRNIRIWANNGDSFDCKTIVTTQSPVITVDFLPQPLANRLFLAAGTETGRVFFSMIDTKSFVVLKTAELRLE